MNRTSVFVLAFGAVLSSSSAVASGQISDYNSGIILKIFEGGGQGGNEISLNESGNPLSASLQGVEYNPVVGLGQPSTFISSAAAVAAPFGGPLSGGTPYVYASAQSEGSRDARSFVYLNYYFSVNGPTSSLIPLIAEFNFSNLIGTFSNGIVTHTIGAGSSELQFAIAPIGSNQIAISSESRCGLGYAIGCGPGNLISQARNFQVQSNTEYLIVLFASSYARQIGGGIGINFSFAETFLDPYLAIDPLFSEKDQYQLNFSTGVGNSPLPPPSAVPEMDIWATMVIGFGMIGLVARRRLKQPFYLRS